MRKLVCILAALSVASCVDLGPELGSTRFKGRVAFGVVTGEGEGFIYSDIMVLDGDGTLLKITSAENCYSRRPDITRDGTKIAFTSCAYRSTKVFICNTDGTELRTVTRDSVIEEFPTWSRDGRYLAFISFRDGRRDIFLMDDATGEIEKVTHSDGSYWIGNWSADNTTLVYYGYRTVGSVQGDIYSFNMHNRTSRPLTMGEGWKLQPRITPDGLLIAYQRNWRLHFLYADGTIDAQVVTVPDSVSDQMQWSSQGDFLVFQAFANGRWDIYRINRNGTGLANLTEDSFEGYTPVLSPDDNEIAYIVKAGTVSKVYLMNNNGENKRALTNRNQMEFSPSWGYR